ncbi:MAG: SdrD B-like domain-containing protein, partial [Chitinophagales bacterium]
ATTANAGNNGNDANDSDANPTTGQSHTTNLEPGEHDPTLDAGFYPEESPLASLGDYVWLDSDKDGIQDDNEEGIEGVTVTLYDGDGNEIGTTTTDENGYYEFTELQPGDYYVVFGTPEGYEATTANAGNNGNDANDSDANPTTGQSHTTNLSPGEHDPTLDAGFYPEESELASLGDYVWLDVDADGQQEFGEPGIEGVQVILYDGEGNEIGVTMTDENGYYIFENLPPGDYYVVFGKPAGYNSTDRNVGNDSTDSDAGPNGQSQTVSLEAGEHNPTIDAGFYLPASLGDTVWFDTDGDGVQDEDEEGIEGVLVTLYDEDGNVVATTTTDENGFYEFTNLVPGTYTVTVPTTGPNSSTPTTAISMTTTLESGEHDPTLDFGYELTGLASLGDYVWEDLDADGEQDANESGIEGVLVTLFDGNGNELATTTTDENGYYLFDNLEPGDYYVVFTAPTGFEATSQNDGSTDANDSDADPITGQSHTTNLVEGEHDPTLDAGFYQLAGLGDTVWLDENGNGVQDEGEEGIAGIPVKLFDEDGNLIATTVTDENGNYSFTDLEPGIYTVSVPNFGPDGSILTTPNNQTTSLSSGEYDPTLDFGYVPATASIGDTVWMDANSNGIQDEGEEGIPGVTVHLTDENGNIISSTVTDSNGEYTFNNLPPNTYGVEVEVSTAPEDSSPTTNTSTFVELGVGEAYIDADFGFNVPELHETASIESTVWMDDNGNGIQEAGEEGIEGVLIVLLDEDGDVIATTTTDENGDFIFDNLPPGDYTIVVNPDDLENLDATTNTSIDATLDLGENEKPGIGFGFTPDECAISIEANVICNSSNASYDVIISIVGGQAPYTITGSYNGTTNGIFEIPAITNGNGYEVIVEDVNGCRETLSVESQNCVTLPVELIDFNGEVQEQGNYLTWATASELNNDFFTLEYSLDGENFKFLTYINGQGTTSAANRYDFLHENAPNGIVYYQLSQTDFDGTRENLGVISLTRKAAAFDLQIENIAPIPAQNFTNVSFSVNEESPVTIELYDAAGRLVIAQTLDATTGMNQVRLDLANVAAGIYVVRLTSSDAFDTQRIVKQ